MPKDRLVNDLALLKMRAKINEAHRQAILEDQDRDIALGSVGYQVGLSCRTRRDTKMDARHRRRWGKSTYSPPRRPREHKEPRMATGDWQWIRKA